MSANTDDDSVQDEDEARIGQLQALLDRVPAPLQPLDVCAVDGYLCGLLLQPRPPLPTLWLPCITDLDGRELPDGFETQALHAAVQRRHALLQRALGTRSWFDPWIFELDPPASVAQAVLPWVAGFAAAMDRFPALMQLDDARLLEPLALLYRHFEPDDLDEAEPLLAVIETLEPPADLSEAVQDLVRSLMLMADVVHPLEQPAQKAPPRVAGRHAQRRTRR